MPTAPPPPPPTPPLPPPKKGWFAQVNHHLDGIEPSTAYAALFVSCLFLYGMLNSLAAFRPSSLSADDNPIPRAIVGLFITLCAAAVALFIVAVTFALIIRLLTAKPTEKTTKTHRQLLDEIHDDRPFHRRR